VHPQHAALREVDVAPKMRPQSIVIQTFALSEAWNVFPFAIDCIPAS